MRFRKYHALGNDYLVLRETSPRAKETLTPSLIQKICHRHFGVGADGILLWTKDHTKTRLRIFNPDGSEAEKSGNGLRIFARFLFDEGMVGTAPFEVETLGGRVVCQVQPDGTHIRVAMGHVVIEELHHALRLSAQTLPVHIANVGNPHCVVFVDAPTPHLARTLGAEIETHTRFPNKTNVQFVRVVHPQHLQLEIWERGAGYTLASGSSSCAAAAIAVKLGLCAPCAPIVCQMPGGELVVEIDEHFCATQTGTAVRVADIELFV